MEGLQENYLRVEDEREGLKREMESSPLLDQEKRLESIEEKLEEIDEEVGGG